MGDLPRMGLILRLRSIPSPRGLDHANYCLAPGVHVDMLHGNLLLALAAMAIERIEQHGVGARQLERDRS